jgi:predicted peptidase
MIKHPLLLAACILLLSVSCRKRADGAASIDDIIVETESPRLVLETELIQSNLNGLYVSLPALYPKTTKKYPLLIFIHGGGQLGQSPEDLLLLKNDGIAQLISVSKFPANFVVQGKNFSFIVLNPQFKSYPSPDDLMDILQFARKKYRVNDSRVYLSGLSMGGTAVTETAGVYTSTFAAIVPISGATNDTVLCKNIAAGALPVWALHNDKDPTVSVEIARNFISLVNGSDAKMPPKLTIFNSAVHDAWTQAIRSDFKEGGLNIYEWMLQYTR